MKVKVKWERQVISDLELNEEEPPQVFKEQLYKLTGVPPERQKLLIRGALVKDSWESVRVVPDCAVLMLGSKEVLPSGPSVKTIFLEDMTESQLSEASGLPPGLKNLGNTCYMSATIQCLRTVPELRTALRSLKGQFSHGAASKENLGLALRDQLDLMDMGYTTSPVGVLVALHHLFPRFAEKDTAGKWKQQDANEFWIELVNTIDDLLTSIDPPINTINQYLSGAFQVNYICTESESEPTITNEEIFYQLSCFISSETKYIQLGLESNLTENLTKHSTVLNRDAVFKKSCKIKRLPAYLTIQLVRFYYKEKENVNAKVLRDVKFPLDFDAYQLCTSELQEKLKVMRDKIKKMEEDSGKNKEVKVESGECDGFSFEDDPGSSNCGLYRLRAVLTHKGRSSSSGHYVAWVMHQVGGTHTWVRCDDANVSLVTEEYLLKLSGGGDWHSAYILLYGPRTVMKKN